MSYIILKGRWCHIIVLKVRAPIEDRIDYVKNSFCEELKRVFDKFPKYDMKILLGYFNSKVGREDSYKPTIGNESSHEISDDSEVRLVNFATPKNLTTILFGIRKKCLISGRSLFLYQFTQKCNKTD
jgi:hypothetical protein